jgi:dolichol-phosphate mannosyltransferase
MTTFSFIIPIFNEAETLSELTRRMQLLLNRLSSSATDETSEVILIDDGSRDQSFELMKQIAEKDSRFKLLQLSRNFGHQVAITAGMDEASGRAIVILDADLQDPPEVIEQMIQKWREGYEHVYAIRKSRAGETFFKKWTARVYYRLLKKLSQIEIPLDSGDFRLVDRQALDAFLQMREKHRFVRGMMMWVGFRQTAIEYERQERFAGETKYPFKKMLQLALDGILSFSQVPLRFVLQMGLLISFLSIVLILYGIVQYFLGHTLPGWASLFTVVSFFGGIQLVVLGMLGEYLGRIHEEVKQRPLYLIRKRIGFGDSQ